MRGENEIVRTARESFSPSLDAAGAPVAASAAAGGPAESGGSGAMASSLLAIGASDGGSIMRVGIFELSGRLKRARVTEKALCIAVSAALFLLPCRLARRKRGLGAVGLRAVRVRAPRLEGSEVESDRKGGSSG